MFHNTAIDGAKQLYKETTLCAPLPGDIPNTPFTKDAYMTQQAECAIAYCQQQDALNADQNVLNTLKQNYPKRMSTIADGSGLLTAEGIDKFAPVVTDIPKPFGSVSAGGLAANVIVDKVCPERTTQEIAKCLAAQDYVNVQNTRVLPDGARQAAKVGVTGVASKLGNLYMQVVETAAMAMYGVGAYIGMSLPTQ